MSFAAGSEPFVASSFIRVLDFSDVTKWNKSLFSFNPVNLSSFHVLTVSHFPPASSVSWDSCSAYPGRLIYLCSQFSDVQWGPDTETTDPNPMRCSWTPSGQLFPVVLSLAANRTCRCLSPGFIFWVFDSVSCILSCLGLWASLWSFHGLLVFLQ